MVGTPALEVTDLYDAPGSCTGKREEQNLTGNTSADRERLNIRATISISKMRTSLQTSHFSTFHSKALEREFFITNKQFMKEGNASYYGRKKVKPI